MLKTLLPYRQFIWRRALADLQHRYTGTGLGIFWNVISPLMQIAVYATVFSQLMPARLPGDESPARFVVYLCTGLLPWIAFSDCVIRSMNSLLDNAAYLRKLPIPEAVFPAQTATASTLSLSISLMLVLLLAAALQQPIGWTWLLAPLVCVLWMTLGLGLGLLLGAMNVFIRDIGQIVQVAFLIWMWTLPVVYVVNILPQALRPWLWINPPYAFLHALHECVVYLRPPTPGNWALMLGWSGGALLAGLLAMRSLRAEMRDVL